MKKIFCIILSLILSLPFFNSVVFANSEDTIDFYQIKQNLRTFSLKINKDAKKIVVPYTQHAYINYNLGYSEAFTINFYNKKSVLKKSLSLQGYDKGNGYKIDELKGISYEEGDYFKISMSGNNINYILRDHLYTGNQPTLRLTIKNNKFVAINEKPPTIEGADNINIEKGEKFNFFTDITSKNFLGEDITKKITVEGSVIYGTIGSYKLTYSVKDMEMESKFTRIVNVVEPKNKKYEITKPKIKKQFNTNNYFKYYQERDNYFRVVFTK